MKLLSLSQFYAPDVALFAYFRACESFLGVVCQIRLCGFCLIYALWGRLRVLWPCVAKSRVCCAVCLL